MSKIFNENNASTIGQKIRILRNLLKLTQEEFATHLQVSRVTMLKIEKLQSVDDLSSDTAFRLYYLTSKIIETPDVNPFFISCSSEIKKEVDNLLENRCKIS